MRQVGGDDAGLERAQLLSELGRFDEAVEALIQQIHRDPSNQVAWAQLSLAQLNLGRLDEALYAAQRAVSLDPDDPWAHRLAGLAFERLGRRPAAIAEFRVALQLEPHSWRSIGALAEALTDARATRGEAFDLAQRAVLIAPNEADVWVTLGNVELARRNTRAADEAFRRALALNPNHAGARNDLARVGLKGLRPGAGGLVAAAEGFATVLASDPRSRTGAYNLGLVLRMFIGRVAVFVFLDAFLLARVFGDRDDLLLRVVPVVILGAPAWLAVTFVGSLSRGLRRELARVALSPRLLGPVLLSASAVGCLVAAAVVPHPWRQICILGGAMSALVGRLLMVLAQQSYARRSPRATRRYRVDTGVVVVGALATGMVAALSANGLRVDATDRGALVALAIFGLLTGLQVRALVRRWTRARRERTLAVESGLTGPSSSRGTRT